MVESTRLLGFAFALALVIGCTKRTTEIRVRDPGRVQVSLREGSGARPVLPPDSREGGVLVPSSEKPPPMVIRARGNIALRWPSAREVSLIDTNGMFPTLRTDVKAMGPFIYVDYDVSESEVLEPGRSRERVLPIQITTPVDNIESASQVTARRRWPGYVCVPLGGVFTLAGTYLVTASDDRYAELAGGFYLLAGIPLLAYGIYVLVDPAEVTPVIPH